MLLPERQDFVDRVALSLRPRRLQPVPGIPHPAGPEYSRSAGQRETYARTMICLEVLQERGLLRFTAEPNLVQIRLQPISGKVDLEASEILQALRRMLE